MNNESFDGDRSTLSSSSDSAPVTHTDLLEGVYRYVSNLPILMKHPWRPTETLEVLYSGETVRGVPHGLGSFAWGEVIFGFGAFENGELHGSALVGQRDGYRRACNFSDGLMNGFLKIYFPEGETGLAGGRGEEDIGGWAQYIGGCYKGAASGYGASFNMRDNGDTMIGQFRDNREHEVEESCIGEDGTRCLFRVRTIMNEQGDAEAIRTPI